jgi:hypothetical protein
MREADVMQGDKMSKVVCVWCGGVIRLAAVKPSQGMCQTCFAHMMREHCREHRLRPGRGGASER